METVTCNTAHHVGPHIRGPGCCEPEAWPPKMPPPPTFTPGPWRWEDRYTDHTANRIARLLVSDAPGLPHNDPVIFALRDDWLGERSPDRAAAERLITEAPAMYAALRLLLERADALIFRPSVDDSRRIDADTRALREVLEPARAVLTKVETK